MTQPLPELEFPEEDTGQDDGIDPIATDQDDPAFDPGEE